MTEFEGKTAVVLGGSSGIGEAVAQGLLAGGADVTVVSRSGTAPAGCTAIALDVTDFTGVETMLGALVKTKGQLDIAINCAGVEMKPARLHETDPDVITQMLQVNLNACLMAMRSELALMLLQKSGCIVNLSSVAGGRGFAGGASYAASKAGVELATRSCAHEYSRDGIRINAVAPGLIETPMAERMRDMDPAMYDQMVAAMPYGRAGRPQEAAEAVLFLASERASFVNGEILVADSGYMA
jgi:NAD(P)-dependent dehydrogenase (short-subunit alcohol dehydrogenase family)